MFRKYIKTYQGVEHIYFTSDIIVYQSSTCHAPFTSIFEVPTVPCGKSSYRCEICGKTWKELLKTRQMCSNGRELCIGYYDPLDDFGSFQYTWWDNIQSGYFNDIHSHEDALDWLVRNLSMYQCIYVKPPSTDYSQFIRRLNAQFENNLKQDFCYLTEGF